MAEVVVNNRKKEEWLTALAAATPGSPGPLNEPTLRLFSNSVLIDADGAVAQFEESAFGGYAAVADLVVDGVGFNAESGMIEVVYNSETFTADGTDPEQIYGWVLTNAAGDEWLAGLVYDEPVNVGVPGQLIRVDPSVPW